jgi:hypothetical protein
MDTCRVVMPITSLLFRMDTMKNSLKVRRQKLVRQLDLVNRQIASTQKSLSRIESRITALKQQPRAKAA